MRILRLPLLLEQPAQLKHPINTVKEESLSSLGRGIKRTERVVRTRNGRKSGNLYRLQAEGNVFRCLSVQNRPHGYWNVSCLAIISEFWAQNAQIWGLKNMWSGGPRVPGPWICACVHMQNVEDSVELCKILPKLVLVLDVMSNIPSNCADCFWTRARPLNSYSSFTFSLHLIIEVFMISKSGTSTRSDKFKNLF